MNRSGYDKVYQLLLAHPDMQDALVRARAGAESARTVDYTVKSIDTESYKPRAKMESRVTFVVETGNGRRWEQSSSPDFSIERFVTKAVCQHVVDDWFGTKVKTYGCDKHVCVNGLKAHRGLGGQRREYTKHMSLYSWIVDRADLLVPEIPAARSRLGTEQEVIRQSEEFARKCAESQAEAAAEAIKATISRFIHLGDDVVREGLSLASVEHVMDL